MTEDGQVASGGTTAAQTLSISYDPADRTYTVARPDGTRSFAPADRQAIDGTSRVVYEEYQRAVTNGFENLLISRVPAGQPSQVNYVGNGLFVRQLQDGTGFEVSTDAFLFGIATAAADMPVSGSATYGVYALGNAGEGGFSPVLFKSRQAGELKADFGAGTVSVDGYATAFDIVNGGTFGDYQYTGNAAITSNGFSGDFSLGSIEGTWDGSFFGPGAVEVGAAFRSDPGVFDYVGTLIGSSTNEFRGISTSFLDIRSVLGFGTVFLESYGTYNGRTGEVTAEGGQVNLVNGPGTFGGVLYDPFGQRWSFNNTFNYSATQENSAQSSQAFAVYGDNLLDASGADGMQVLRPGSPNPLIELTYTSFASFAFGGGPDPDADYRQFYYVFGFETDPANVPTTGSATYSAVVRGIAASRGTDDIFYGLEGSADLAVNFAGDSWSGSVFLTGAERNSSATRDFGTFTIAPGVITGNELSQTGLLNGSNDTVGGIFARLFGPQAQEVGGGLFIDAEDPLETGNFLDIDGVFFGKRD